MVNSFIRQIEDGGKVPKPLFNRPSLHPLNERIWGLWQDLTSARQNSGHGPNPLSITDIVNYFNIIGVKDTQVRRDYLYILQIMDRAYLTRWVETHNKKK